MAPEPSCWGTPSTIPGARDLDLGPGKCLLGYFRPPGPPPGVVRAVPESLHPNGNPEEELMSANYDKLVQVIEEVRGDVEKAEAGNKAACARVRKAMQEIQLKLLLFSLVWHMVL